ncbi:hypothetical protein D5F01_LYC06153 [Larimichthys crocea]|uniref:Uncharacterized protein n=1 Tax=Larimichthys crocea TaxID=215358 RepID=A0A6G0IV67_LARCR|nr:hypothetical protein D5F01_LYC06153 [Larimichthys crocea]
MMPRLSGGGRTTCGTTGTFLSACLVSVCQALRSCGEVQCGDGQQCCPPIVNENGSASSAVRCCKLPIHISSTTESSARGPAGTRTMTAARSPPSSTTDTHLRPRIPCWTGTPNTASGDFASPNLPAYDEVKYLPTYEESMQEMHRDRSDDNLLSENERGGQGRVRAAGPRAGEQRRDVLEASGPQHSPRTSRNSV